MTVAARFAALVAIYLLVRESLNNPDLWALSLTCAVFLAVAYVFYFGTERDQ